MSGVGVAPAQDGAARLAVTACLTHTGYVTADLLGAQLEVLSKNKRSVQLQIVSGLNTGQVIQVPKEEVWRAVCYASETDAEGPY